MEMYRIINIYRNREMVTFELNSHGVRAMRANVHTLIIEIKIKEDIYIYTGLPFSGVKMKT